MSARPEPAHAARYFAWLYSPAPAQRALAALFAIEGEIRAALRPGLEHRVAHVRLEWWREECARLCEGRPQHPLARELLGLCPQGHAMKGPDLSGLVRTATWDLAAAIFETRAELSDYCEAWAGALTQVAARCAAPTLEAEEAARFGCGLGRSLRESELLGQLRADAHTGRLRLPLDELERAAIDPRSLARAPWPRALGGLLRERGRALRGELAASVAELPRSLQPPLRGLMVWAALAVRELKRLERDPHTARPGAALAGGWAAWRAARRAQQQRFTLAEVHG